MNSTAKGWGLLLYKKLILSVVQPQHEIRYPNYNREYALKTWYKP